MLVVSKTRTFFNNCWTSTETEDAIICVKSNCSAAFTRELISISIAHHSVKESRPTYKAANSAVAGGF